MPIPKTKDLLDTNRTILSDAFLETEYPWEILPHLRRLVAEKGKTLPQDQYRTPTEGVWIHRTATVSPTAHIAPPAIICEGAEIRHGAFLRGSTVVGKGAVVGNSTELKNAVLFDLAQVPHYNYVGDGILGYKAHMGAGAIASNLKSDKSPVSVKGEGETLSTSMTKCSAVLGDGAEVGCGCVLCPGTIVGRGSRVYPLSLVRGVIPPKVIYKSKNEVVRIEENI